MWLFKGQCAQHGPAIVAVTAVAVCIAILFLRIAARSVRRSDLGWFVVVGVAAVSLGYSSGFSEPVFVGSSLNAGAALFIGITAIGVGIIGVFVIKKFRLLRVLVLIAGAGILFGDAAGWLYRSAQPSKYDVGENRPGPGQFP
jgi:hypothetical protein